MAIFHRATKSFNFCYGHRVWSQKLDTKYSLDGCHACRHLHGHEGLLKVTMRSAYLKDGMVTDFKHLNWLKDAIDTVVDHKFIIDINDPNFERIVGKDRFLFPQEFKGLKYQTVALSGLDELERELMESFVIVDFVPTSENLALWFMKAISEYMEPLGVEIESVELHETPKSQAVAVREL